MDLSVVLLVALMFVAMIMLLEGVLQLGSALRNPGARAVGRRLRLLDSGQDPDELYRLLRRKRESHGWFDLGVLRAFYGYLQQAGVRASFGLVLLMLALIVVAVGAAVTALLHVPPWLGFGAGASGVVSLALLFVAAKRKQRLAALESQLPELLEIVVRSVRSGHPLGTAMRVAADELPEPLGSELKLLIQETHYGIALTDAIDDLAERVGLSDYQYFAVVATLTSKTGGNLASVLENLAAVMRARNRMRRKVRAISAEGRTSGLVMSLAPPAIAGMILLVSPNFFLDVADDPIFTRLVVFVGLMSVVNALVLRKLVNFEI